MANLLSKLELIAIKIETAQGTVAAPAATDFFYASNVDVGPAVDYLPRDWTHADLDQIADARGAVRMKGKFTIWLNGSGTAGTAFLPLDAVLQMAGFVPTVSAGVSVTYNLTSSPTVGFFTLGKSATIEIYKGASASVSGLFYTITGAVATKLNFIFEAKKPVVLEVEFDGLYTAVSAAVAPAHTPTMYTPPIMQSASFSIQTYAATISKFTLDMGLKAIERDDLNQPYSISGFQITERKPKITFDPEATIPATHDWWGLMVSGAQGAVSIEVGTGAGKVTTVTMPQVDYQNIKHGDRNGILTLDGEAMVNRNAGDDSVVITQT